MSAAIARWLGGLVILALVGWGLHARGDSVGYARGHAEAVHVKQQWDDDRERMTIAAGAAETQHAHDEATRLATQLEQEKLDAQAKILRVADQRRADAAHRSLLDDARQAAAAADQCGSEADTHSTAVAGGDAPQRPAAVLAEVLGRADSAAGELASFADGLSDALGVCRIEYQSLIDTNGS